MQKAPEIFVALLNQLLDQLQGIGIPIEDSLRSGFINSVPPRFLWLQFFPSRWIWPFAAEYLEAVGWTKRSGTRRVVESFFACFVSSLFFRKRQDIKETVVPALLIPDEVPEAQIVALIKIFRNITKLFDKVISDIPQDQFPEYMSANVRAVLEDTERFNHGREAAAGGSGDDAGEAVRIPPLADPST